MNIFKKTVACLAAATVMTSMAVTASAEYQINGEELDDSYHLIITGIPQDVFNYPLLITAMVTFDNGGDVSTQKAIECNLSLSNNTTICKIIDSSRNEYGALTCGLRVSTNDEEIGISIRFDKDNEYLAEFMKCTQGSLCLRGTTKNSNDEMQSVYFNSNGDTRAESYFEPVSFTWQALNSASEPVSEPTSSEPASEPVSEPTSSEPVSEPASEPVSSEPAPSQPNNVDTGTAGVAAVVGTAVLAAGAVIVTRKKK